MLRLSELKELLEASQLITIRKKETHEMDFNLTCYASTIPFYYNSCLVHKISFSRDGVVITIV